MDCLQVGRSVHRKGLTAGLPGSSLTHWHSTRHRTVQLTGNTHNVVDALSPWRRTIVLYRIGTMGAGSYLYAYIYTVPQKVPTFKLSVSLSNLNQFSKCLHY